MVITKIPKYICNHGNHVETFDEILEHDNASFWFCLAYAKTDYNIFNDMFQIKAMYSYKQCFNSYNFWQIPIDYKHDLEQLELNENIAIHIYKWTSRNITCVRRSPCKNVKEVHLGLIGNKRYVYITDIDWILKAYKNSEHLTKTDEKEKLIDKIETLKHQIHVLTGGFGYEMHQNLLKQQRNIENKKNDCIVCYENEASFKTSCGCKVICALCYYDKLEKKECPVCFHKID